MNRDLLKFEFKSNRNLIIFIAVIDFIFLPLLYSLDAYIEPVWIACLFFMEAIIIPAILLNQINSKNGTDFYFSLPISKKDYYLSILLFGLIIILIPILINAGLTFILVGLKDVLDVSYVINSLLGILVGVVSYIVSYAIFLKFYSTVDGVLGILGYLVLPLILMVTLIVVLNSNLEAPFWSFRIFEWGFMEYTPFLPYTMVLFSYPFDYIETSTIIIHFIYLVIYVLMAFVSIFRDIKNRKSEYANQISSHPLAYPLLINVMMICLMFGIISTSSDLLSSITFLLIAFVIYNIMQFIYRRNLKITKKTIISYICIILCVGITNFAINKVENVTFEKYTPTIKSYNYMDLVLEYENSNSDILRLDLYENDVIKNEPWLMNLQNELEVNKDVDSGKEYGYIQLALGGRFVNYNCYGYYNAISVSPNNAEFESNLRKLLSAIKYDHMNVSLNYEQVEVYGVDEIVEYISEFVKN